MLLTLICLSSSLQCIMYNIPPIPFVDQAKFMIITSAEVIHCSAFRPNALGRVLSNLVDEYLTCYFYISRIHDNQAESTRITAASWQRRRALSNDNNDYSHSTTYYYAHNWTTMPSDHEFTIYTDGLAGSLSMDFQIALQWPRRLGISYQHCVNNNNLHPRILRFDLQWSSFAAPWLVACLLCMQTTVTRTWSSRPACPLFSILLWLSFPTSNNISLSLFISMCESGGGYGRGTTSIHPSARYILFFVGIKAPARIRAELNGYS